MNPLKKIPFKISGIGRIIRKATKMIDDNEPIEYGKSDDDKGMMNELAGSDNTLSTNDSDEALAEKEQIEEEIEKQAEEMEQDKNLAFPEQKAIPIDIPPSVKNEFDPNGIQNALEDSEKEGGVFKMRTTGFSSMDNERQAGPDYYKPQAELNSDSAAGKFEISGFTVQYEPKKGAGLCSVQIRDYFEDLETAKASVSSSGYLIPLKNGYKIGRISLGCPIICYNERQIFEFVNGSWRRV